MCANELKIKLITLRNDGYCSIFSVFDHGTNRMEDTFIEITAFTKNDKLPYIVDELMKNENVEISTVDSKNAQLEIKIPIVNILKAMLNQQETKIKPNMNHYGTTPFPNV